MVAIVDFVNHVIRYLMINLLTMHIFIFMDTHQCHHSNMNKNYCVLYSFTDLECIFTVICNLVTKSESPDEELEMAKLISAKITHQPNEKPALRLKM